MQPPPNPTALLILGMHRSGTSSVTGLLHHLGVALGQNLMPAKADNPKGFFEHQAIVDLHDEILKTLNTAWDDPRSLSPGWEQSPQLAPHREQLLTLLRQDFTGISLWAIKDPRLCRLLPLWLSVLAELNVTPKVIFVLRDPAEVIASLQHRNGTGREQAAMLWLSYTVAAEHGSRTLPRSVVRYEDCLTGWRTEVQRLRTGLALNLPAPTPDQQAKIDAFLDAGLRHPASSAAEPFTAPQNAWVAPLYESLLAWRQTNAAPTATCDSAAQALTQAEHAAAPVLQYLTVKAAHEKEIALVALRNHYEATLKSKAAEHAERLNILTTLQASTSWRITRPLRWLMARGK